MNLFLTKMFPWLQKILCACMHDDIVDHPDPLMCIHDDIDDDPDTLMWSRALETHSCGEFSFAVAQANMNLEDHSQVETGSAAIFLGVYDGHDGIDATRFVRNNLFNHVIRIIQENGAMSEEVLRDAVAATEQGFMDVTQRDYRRNPRIVKMGSCCLVGVIWNGTLYIANLGDSRAVICYVNRYNNIIAQQLTREHNVNYEEAKQELMQMHPDDRNIVYRNNGAMRVKGIIQLSRTIGDAYLKRPQFSLDPTFPQNYVPPPFNRPVLSAEPDVYRRALRGSDRFLIFASDGLWEHLTNQEAAEIVHKNPRTGIAETLVKAALKVATIKEMPAFRRLTRIPWSFHDDITVIVVFIDQDLLNNTTTVRDTVPALSFKGFVDSVEPSNFNNVEQFMSAYKD